jgi:CheY-like chemotaxis protein
MEGTAAVLVVDDHPQARVVTAEIFESMGFVVYTALHAEQALRVLVSGSVRGVLSNGHPYRDPIEVGKFAGRDRTAGCEVTRPRLGFFGRRRIDHFVKAASSSEPTRVMVEFQISIRRLRGGIP